MSIIAIDNDEIFLRGLRDLLEQASLPMESVSDPFLGLNLISENPEKFKIVILDYHMPGKTGEQLAIEIKSINKNIKIIMLSGTDDENIIRSCYEAGAEHFFKKEGTKSQNIIYTVKGLFAENSMCEVDPNQENTERENSLKIRKTLKMEGRSRALAQIANQVELYGPSNENILIQGESGTGKEQVARAIHQNSSRHDGPFICINCGAIPKDLLESELFGHIKGAFTGASQTKIGKFQLANNGTLFLDEIGDMDLSLQVKILRAIQERTIEPVGGNHSIKVNIRIIAATHRNLNAAVKSGNFREDLFYRLKVLSIGIPPLRERPEDIEPLVMHFINLKQQETGTKKSISDAAMRILKSSDWPGNVRQLEAAIKHAYIHAIRVIQPESLDQSIKSETASRITNLRSKTGIIKHSELVDSFNEIERNLLEDALRLAGTKSAAAELLDISHQAMNYRRKKLGLDLNNEKSLETNNFN